MDVETGADSEALEIAQRWCALRGENWQIRDQAGRGGTAPVFSVETPTGVKALKIYDLEFSAEKKGAIERKRIDQQLALGAHECPYVIQVLDGGVFEDRLFVLMNKAPGLELEKRLTDIPRKKIRCILDQVTQGVMFLRSKGICHRDIKSANIFISDDFCHATLLDLSVMRDIHDPVGIGTDHDGQLPIVATARYSPPEYLFRLLEPGLELWHALDVYQLGGLLHDLIMKRPLFDEEYSRSKENRYRFAWAVATVTPAVQAMDVDQTLCSSQDARWTRTGKGVQN
jgi:eukaryotic-like serine/threonine-protein kinase